VTVQLDHENVTLKEPPHFHPRPRMILGGD